jgi:hypothetical protein
MFRRTVSNPILEYFGYKGGQSQEQVGTGSNYFRGWLYRYQQPRYKLRFRNRNHFK